MKISLTNDEWISLIDGVSDDSNLQTCCANISALRDVVITIVRQGRNDEIMDWVIRDLKKCMKWVADGHDLTPLLQKICDQIEFDPSAVEHEKDRVEL